VSRGTWAGGATVLVLRAPPTQVPRLTLGMTEFLPRTLLAPGFSRANEEWCGIPEPA